MDSINFCESPIRELHRQARQRVIYLMGILGFWTLGISVILWVSHALIAAEEKKIVFLKKSLEEMKIDSEKLAQKKTSHCAAQVLKSLIDAPIKGVTISSLSFSEDWTIQGKSLHAESIFLFKAFMQDHLNNIVWTQENLSFTLIGSMKC